MTPSLQWLQRELGVGDIGADCPGSVPRVQTAAPLAPPPPSTLPSPLSCSVFQRQLPFQGGTHKAASRKLTSGLGMGCRCLRGDSPLLGSGRSTGSYTNHSRRRWADSGAGVGTAKGRATSLASHGLRTSREAVASTVAHDTCPGSRKAIPASGDQAQSGDRRLCLQPSPSLLSASAQTSPAEGPSTHTHSFMVTATGLCLHCLCYQRAECVCVCPHCPRM